ncbi:MAG: hypothetical protein FWC34_08100 [Bacteroidetes bacterium]|nr:hypothetical protein [Bacteroidota bacterium]MCL2301662.1 hypothetical protein [Lentimicrobiaceae bacterium]
MLIIHDKRLPKKVIIKLGEYGECLPFYSENITYQEISGHPDIFFFPSENHVIVASNTPSYFINFLKNKGISIKIGHNSIGSQKENSTCYNVVMTENFIIHNRKFTDTVILENFSDKTFIHVNQAYTRCSLLPLKNDTFITSDKGIEKELSKHGLTCLYISPKEILLPGYPHGFIGGCMGVYENNIFLIGYPKYHSEGEKLESFLRENNYKLISLYDGKFFDGGGVFFILLPKI